MQYWIAGVFSIRRLTSFVTKPCKNEGVSFPDNLRSPLDFNLHECNALFLPDEPKLRVREQVLSLHV